MAVTLHKAGYDRAVALLKRGLEVAHDPQAWNDARPDRNDSTRYLDSHSLTEYGLWFLGVDTDLPDSNSGKFLYPYGDFSLLHVGALRDVVRQAEKHLAIKEAAQKLLDMVKNHKK